MHCTKVIEIYSVVNVAYLVVRMSELQDFVARRNLERFDRLRPFATSVEEQYFAVHAGISKGGSSLVEMTVIEHRCENFAT